MLERIKSLNLKVSAIAKKAGVAPATVKRFLEKGESRKELYILYAISKLSGKTLDYIIMGV